jgi:uncharacterized ferredoxin-like protein
MTSKAIEMVSELMELSARTAPKGRGLDSIVTRIVVGKELKELAEEVHRMGMARGLKFLIRDSTNLEQSDACVLIGCIGTDSVGLDCGGCGYGTCKEMRDAQELFKAKIFKGKDKLLSGPNCAIKMADLGIALGSAARTASLHNADNRIMLSAGVGALSLGWMGGCNVVYGLPLKASGKSIYFDRPS